MMDTVIESEINFSCVMFSLLDVLNFEDGAERLSWKAAHD